MKWKSAVLITLLLAVAHLAAQTAPSDSLGPTADQWVGHLQNDMLPFYSVPAALGNPVGQFPSTRCDDGSALNFQKPCPPIAGNSYLMAPEWYLVPMSRQVFGYGVAFHMTGDTRYLEWMKAGIDVLRNQFIDRTGGGMYLQMDLTIKQWGPDVRDRDPQQLGYGLLGMAFYYYLTRDATILPDIIAGQRYIYSHYWNPSLGSMQWLLRSNGSTAFDQLQLTACLDQMNTYLVLLAPIVPEPYRTEMQDEMRVLIRSMLSIYYAPASNLFFTSANQPADTDFQQTYVDVGHTSKAIWMSRFAGLMNGDPNLVAWTGAAARRHLARTWIDADGSWAGGVVPGGDLDRNKNWWVFSELDQLAGTLALEDPATASYLSRSSSYWFTYFVDHTYGDVWNGVDFGTNAPQKSYPKAWQWKNAYHAFEHALIGYIVAQEIRHAPFALYFSFAQDTPSSAVSPYYLNGQVQSIEAVGSNVQRVTFLGKAVATPTASAYSAASFLAAPLAPSSFGAIVGQGIGGSSIKITDQSGVSRPAVVSGSTATQLNFVLPAQLATGPAIVTATPTSGPALAYSTTIAPVSPAIFQLDSASLVAANIIRVHADGSQAAEPIASGISFGPASDQLYLVIYATGIRNAAKVSVTIRGHDIPVSYSGPQGAFDGLDQINIGPLPRSLAGKGRLTILVIADGLTANPVQANFP
jgi:uncharacterized protein (TIGR03437 family)